MSELKGSNALYETGVDGVRDRKAIRKLMAPAKINLGLRITGRREDGYHLLESVFWPLTFVDELEVESASHHSVETSWLSDAPFPAALPAEKDNLAFRALTRLPFDRAGWKVKLGKRIPMGAGLGGGSSNAGALLREFLQSHPETADRVAQEAALLGADVPFFLHPSPCWVTGIGEMRTEIPIRSELLVKTRFLLLLLPVGTPTKSVFARYKAGRALFSQPMEISLEKSWGEAEMREYLNQAGNDIADSAAQETPLITQALNALRDENSLYSGVSGTGSTCFSVYLDSVALEKKIKDLQVFCRRYNCKSLGAATFRTSNG